MGLVAAGRIAMIVAAVHDEARVRVLPGVAPIPLAAGDSAMVPDVRSVAFATRGLTWNVSW
jgi:hypothetical protein